MSESTPFELPSPGEKLPYKFILDSLNERLSQTPADSDHVGETPELSSPPSAPLVVEAESPGEERIDGSSEEATEIEISNAPVTRGTIEVPDKKYFRIGEVAELLNVESYVLRYWEGEFKSLRPVKSGSGHRVYTRRDVETLVQIKHLLHEEKFSIKGARQRLAEMKKQVKEHPTSAPVAPRNTEALREIAAELRALIQIARTQL